MATVANPTTEQQLSRIIVDAIEANEPLEVRGSGSKLGLGRPTQTAHTLSTVGLRGLTLYEPTELVVSAFAGTSLAAIQRELDTHNQQLAFEPVDTGPMLGLDEDLGTIGAVFATNLSGSRRNLVGGARDHILGIHAVNGRGEMFKNGGRVMKNVTGYDLTRGLMGSWGTLAVLTEVTMKVLPKAEETRTLIIKGMPDEIAVEVMCSAVGTPFEVSATAHLDAASAARMTDAEIQEAETPITAIRIENFSESVEYRGNELAKLFSPYGATIELDNARSLRFWRDMQKLRFLQGSKDPVWRISTAPKTGPRVVQSIKSYTDCNVVYDWSGGLIWLEVPETADASAADIRRVIAMLGGHVTLMRAEPSIRASVDVFQPLEAGVMKITRKLKETFDPHGILNPGRMYAEL